MGAGKKLVAIGTLSAMSAAGGLYALSEMEAPPEFALHPLSELPPQLPSQERLETLICAADTECTTETALGVIASSRQVSVTLDQIPQHLRESLYAAEDRDFRDHGGIDMRRTVSAFLENLISLSADEGASPLDNQVAGVIYGEMTPEQRRECGLGTIATDIIGNRRLDRQAQASCYAVTMNEFMTKDQIEELYYNNVFFGRNSTGAQAASQAFFGKPVSELTEIEGITLIALLPAPSRMDVNFSSALLPRVNELRSAHEAFRQANPELDADQQQEAFLETLSEEDSEMYGQYMRETTRLKANVDRVIDAKVDAGYITEEEAEVLRAQPINIIPDDRPPLNNFARADQLDAHHFSERALDEAARLTGVDRGQLFGYKITTTLRTDVQAQAQAAVDAVGYGEGDPEIALTHIGHDGDIQAMIGGRDFATSEVNLATVNGRQAGSSQKPFWLATALSHRETPDTVYAAPGAIDIPIEGQEPWHVTGEDYGEATLATATAHSLNTVYAQLAERYGAEEALTIAQRLGLDSSVAPEDATLSTVLGTNGVSTLGLATSFNGLMNGGQYIENFSVTRITDPLGNVIYDRSEAPAERPQVVTPEISQQVAEVAKGTVREGTAANSFTLDDTNPDGYAGKTGTTQDSTDARFTVVTCETATSVWEGYPDAATPMSGHYGAGVPAQVANRLLSNLPLDPDCDL